MLYLFIFESIGTSELMLIGLVALIVFGPRKLPEFARMLGKARNELKKTTDDFKQTWEREVDFENEKSTSTSSDNQIYENSVERTDRQMKNEIVVPEIKEMSQEDFQQLTTEKETAALEAKNSAAATNMDKRDWL